MIRADRPVHVIAAAYFAAALILSVWLGEIANAQFLIYLGSFLGFAGSILIGVILLRAVRTETVEGSRPASLPLLHRLRAALKPHMISGMLTYAVLALFVGAFTTTKNLLPRVFPFAYDQVLADLDRWMHFGRDPWTWFGSLYQPALLRGAEIFYGAGWGLGTTLTVIYMTVFCTDRQLRMQYLVTWLACWIVLGSLMAGLFLSAGPAFFGHFGGEPQRFAGLVTALGMSGDAPLSAASFQAYLWALHENGRAGFGSGISAFPSLHVSLAALCALALQRVNKVAGLLAWTGAILTLIGSVYLGWHYAVDGYASLVLTLLLWWIVGRSMTGRDCAAASLP